MNNRRTTVNIATDPVVLWTGQTSCHDCNGKEIDCTDSGQDAEFPLAWEEALA